VVLFGSCCENDGLKISKTVAHFAHLIFFDGFFSNLSSLY
jgi:hypothetical protein